MQIEHDPQRATQHDGDDEHGKRERQQIPALVRAAVQVQKVAQVNEYLHHGGERKYAEDEAARITSPNGNTVKISASTKPMR